VNNFYEKALVSTENFWALMRNPFGIEKSIHARKWVLAKNEMLSVFCEPGLLY